MFVCYGVSDESNNLKVYPFQQPIDHFVFGVESNNATFTQRIYIDHTYRDGHPNEDGMPILVYLGGEANVEHWVAGGGGIMIMAASKFRALVVYIEHRFYGQSVPLGSIDAAMMDPYVRGCLTSHQALADAANAIRGLKSDWSLQSSPVIAFGGSYVGFFLAVLAAWFRIKYPNIVDGALASSTPVFDSEDLAPENEYCSIVSRDFKDINEKCYDYIAKSWKLMDEVASEPGGIDKLSHTFSSCGILEDISKTVVAITTKQGSHCLDLGPPHDDDPKWLKHQREKELKIIGYWIKTADSSSNQVPGLGIWLVLVSVYFIIVYG
ncbi:uncharacterized protein LOC141589765 [Silene latifolia]|uniref:uncharacterized protein LOC141589765 n=1 Tax=Silene latifolia TaxID=37657 RepID=UPI003D777468